MTDSGYNTVTPVEGLQTVLGLAPTERRQQRQQHQETAQEHREEPAAQAKEEPDDTTTTDEGTPHSIDYRA